jgi:hypothetical protein
MAFRAMNDQKARYLSRLYYRTLNNLFVEWWKNITELGFTYPKKKKTELGLANRTNFSLISFMGVGGCNLFRVG